MLIILCLVHFLNIFHDIILLLQYSLLSLLFCYQILLLNKRDYSGFPQSPQLSTGTLYAHIGRCFCQFMVFCVSLGYTKLGRWQPRRVRVLKAQAPQVQGHPQLLDLLIYVKKMRWGGGGLLCFVSTLRESTKKSRDN